MKKSHVVILSVIITVVVAFASSVATLLGLGIWFYQNSGMLAAPVPADENAVSFDGDYRMLDEVARTIENTSLWPMTEEKSEEMLTYAAKGLVEGMGDTYAYLYTREEYEEMMQDSEGIYVGIGVLVQLDLERDLVEVIRVYEDTPAEEAGVEQGDYFIAVNDEDVLGMDINQVKSRIIGEEGTWVHIKFLRDNDYVEMDIQRRQVIADKLEYKMVDGDIAYISIESFEGNADDLFEKAVRELVHKQGAKGMILDLRDNPGGDKNVVLNIADILLPAGPAFITEDRNGNQLTDSTTSRELGIPLVVLINENSASASELLSGNIKDYGVGTLVGMNTYGKGTVQTFTMLSDGSVLKMTAYEYMTGKGTRVQDVGVAPDIEVEPNEILTKSYKARLTEDDNQFAVAMETVRKLIEEE